MIATIVVSIITVVLITISILFFPKIKIGKIELDTYWMIALLGAIVLLATSLSPINQVGDQLIKNTTINPLKILVLFFSMTFLSIVLDELGLFKYLANVASKKAKDKQMTLFLMFYFLTSVLTIFTSNDIVILTLTPFICMFCKNAKIKAIPYLIAEFTAANTWSLMLVIGNPTNIYLATSAGIDFVNYFKVMALPTLAAGLVELALLYLLFRKHLHEPINVEIEDEHLSNKTMTFIALGHLVVCLIFLIISNYIGIEMYLVSLICATSLLISLIVMSILKKNKWITLGDSLKRLPYPLIPFFLSMFVIVVALNYQGITSAIGNFFGNNQTVWVYGYSSFLASNLINNIPMSILYSHLSLSLDSGNYLIGIFASIIGSNIGAFLTPLGALAGIMFINLVNKEKIDFKFIDFVKYGSTISIPTITAALGILILTINFI